AWTKTMCFILCTPSKRCGMWIHYSCGVMTLPRSGGLNGDEQPQGLPDVRVPRLFKVTVFIPAVDIELLLVAALTAQGLICPSHRGDPIPSRPEGFAVAMALAVADCNGNGSGLQSAHFQDHITCIQRPAQDHITCH